MHECSDDEYCFGAGAAEGSVNYDSRLSKIKLDEFPDLFGKIRAPETYGAAGSSNDAVELPLFPPATSLKGSCKLCFGSSMHEIIMYIMFEQGLEELKTLPPVLMPDTEHAAAWRNVYNYVIDRIVENRAQFQQGQEHAISTTDDICDYIVMPALLRDDIAKDDAVTAYGADSTPTFDFRFLPKHQLVHPRDMLDDVEYVKQATDGCQREDVTTKAVKYMTSLQKIT